MNFDLWYHDGSGFGWPAVETRRSEETTDEFATRLVDVALDKPDLKKLKIAELREKAAAIPLTNAPEMTKAELVEALYGRAVRMEEREVPTGNTVTTVTRDLIVFYTGKPSKKLGLKEGVNVLRDVSEGVPTEAGTCSHIAWQPGTPLHAAMVTHGIAEGEDHLVSETESLRMAILENELALQAVEEQKKQIAADHGIDV